MKKQIALVEEIAKDLPMLPKLDTLDNTVPETNFQHEQLAIGPALRALHSFLIQAKSGAIWIRHRHLMGIFCGCAIITGNHTLSSR